jgi:hypothetical protein
VIRTSRRGLYIAGAALVTGPALAHNNPTLHEQEFLRLTVSPTPLDGEGRCTAPFALNPPKFTVGYVWHVTAGAPAGIRFVLLKDTEVVAEDLADGANSTFFRGQGFAIAKVEGATAPFDLAVGASVAEWPEEKS